MSKSKFKQIEALSIGDVVTKHPELVGVFMKYKVDFCCGGDRNVIEAIQKDTDELDELIGEVRMAMGRKEHEEALYRYVQVHRLYLMAVDVRNAAALKGGDGDGCA